MHILMSTLRYLMLIFVISGIEASAQQIDSDSNVDAGTESRIRESYEFMSNFPESQGGGVISVIEEGLRDQNHEVVKNYLYALQRIGRARGLRFAAAMNENADYLLSEAVIRQLFDLMESPDPSVAYHAALALVLGVPKTESIELEVIENILENPEIQDSESQGINSRQLIALLTLEPALTPELQAWLLNSLRNESRSVAIASLMALHRAGSDPNLILPHLIRLLMDEEFYASLSLLSLVETEYVSEVSPYEAEFEQMRSVLTNQLVTPAVDRTVELTNNPNDALAALNRILERM